jgi:hypothetical protein
MVNRLKLVVFPTSLSIVWMNFMLTLLLQPSWVMGQTVRTFVDDHGVEHSTTKAKPTFLARARFALFFHHFGIGTEQIAAICT